jgi:hypothetical protein
LPKNYRAGEDVVLLGRDPDGGRLACVVHLKLSDGPPFEVFIASLAVEISHRGCGGAVADQAFGEVRRLASTEARSRHCREAVVWGKIDHNNRASQWCAIRAGLEPIEEAADVGDFDDHQLWELHLDLSADHPAAP